MFISVRKYRLAGDIEELNRRVRDEFVPILKQLPGFRGYHTFDAGGGTIVSISLFDSREAALASNDRAREWVARSIAHLVPDPPEIMGGETGVDVGM